MTIELNLQQQAYREAVRSFADRAIAPHAGQFDREQAIPGDLIREMAAEGYLGALIPTEFGGAGIDTVSFGLLNEEIGRSCSSVRSLLTVHSMASHAITRWGRPQQRSDWLPRLASGEVIGAFALSEPNVGSDAKSIETTATSANGSSYRLNGCKKWITFGQIADLFLVFARCKDKPTAFLVERDRPGLSIAPIHGLLGTRASMLAELRFEDCHVPAENMIGGIGFGIAAVALSALDLGRFSVATGCVGIGQACLDASLRYAEERVQFGVPLKDHQLIRQMLTNMITDVKAARLLCHSAGYLHDRGEAAATQETLIAKYFASTMATRVANDAVQIHGAIGCSQESSVQRYLRDAKVMEIIEGSTQIQQLIIAKNAYQVAPLPARPPATVHEQPAPRVAA